jgi:hypothetical protein
MTRAHWQLLLSLGAMGVGVGGLVGQSVGERLRQKSEPLALADAEVEPDRVEDAESEDGPSGRVIQDGALTVHTRQRAEVLLDGEPPLRTPARFHLTAGTHRITFLAPEGQRHLYDVHVPVGASRLTLVRLGEPPMEGDATLVAAAP